MTCRGLWAFCSGPETPTQWKSESASSQQTNLLTGEWVLEVLALELLCFQLNEAQLGSFYHLASFSFMIWTSPNYSWFVKVSPVEWELCSLGWHVQDWGQPEVKLNTNSSSTYCTCKNQIKSNSTPTVNTGWFWMAQHTALANSQGARSHPERQATPARRREHIR